ncbi:ABC transporter permease [Actinomyces bowdenii]|uniref:ABC transporter permease n=1 Tax=Actinomyces bowdenii TaxID=131109 RepID=UPI00214CC60C|nr:ABC transporter permease [Actinomyces bowdenii]
MGRVAWRSIRAHVKQFILTTFAVVLGVAFLSGTLALRAVMSETFSALTASTFTSDLYVTGQPIAQDDDEDSTGPSPSTNEPVNASLTEEIRQIEGVESAHPAASTPVVLVGADDAPVTSSGTPSLAITLFDGESGMTWVQGRRPEGGSEVALESGALERSGLKVGDTTHVVIRGEPQEVAVVGEISYGTPLAGATIIAMDGDWLMPVIAPTGQIWSISVTVSPGADASRVEESITQALPDTARVQTRAEMIEETNASIERILGFVQTFLMVFVVLAMFVGSFIIMNSFAMSVRQRVREFALLRAVGASPASVFAVVFLQALVIGIVGSALGIAAGAVLLKALVALLEAAGMPLTQGVPLTGPIMAISMIVGVAVTIVGALLPAREAALTHPVEAMRATGGAREKSLVGRTIIGSLLLAAGIAATAAAWINADLDQRRLVLGMGAGAIIIGLLVVSPILARPVVGLIGLPLRALRPSGRLAARSITHNPRRTANTSGALLIGMALVCAGATLAASVNTSISDEVNTSMKADLLIQAASPSAGFSSRIPAEMASELAQIDGVEQTFPLALYQASATTEQGQTPNTSLGVVDPASYTEAYDVKIVEGSFEKMDATHVAAFKSTDQQVGDTVTLTGPNGSVEATVVAVVDPVGISASYYVSPQLASTIGTWTAPGAATEADQVLTSPASMFLRVAEGTDIEDVRRQAQDILAPTYQYSVRDAQDISDAAGQQVNRTLAILYGLLGLSIAIAILGIVNTLVLSVAERTREIGLMRAVGMGRAQLAGQIISESVLTALYGTVLGGATGTILAAALRTTLQDQGLTALTIPWAQLAAMLLVSVVVGIIAALWPALRASRLPVLEAIATE